MPNAITKKPIDYTEMEHHNELPNPNEENDISSPQGEFWHRNERPEADSIRDVNLKDPVRTDRPDTPRDPNKDGDKGGTS